MEIMKKIQIKQKIILNFINVTAISKGPELKKK